MRLKRRIFAIAAVLSGLAAQASTDTGIFLLKDEELAQLGFLHGEYRKTAAVVCPFNGEGSIMFGFSADRVESFKARGFGVDQLCIALRLEGLVFDPETGKQLPSYFPVDHEFWGEFRYPLLPPPCFADARAGGSDGWRTLDISGCTIAFDPFSGLPIDEIEEWERERLEDKMLVLEGGGGPAPSEASLAALENSADRKDGEDLAAALAALD